MSSWSYLDYDIPDAVKYDRKQYILGNSFSIDIDVYYGSSGMKEFITMPRFYDGTPVTLGTITPKIGPGGPIIAPFPNFAWQNKPNCTGFISVFVDECERLWVLDSGNINDKQVCLPKLLVFDLRTSCIDALWTHTFPPNSIRNGTLLITPVVDIRKTCKDTMVYIADVTGFGITVFDYKRRMSWRAKSPLLRPNPAYSSFTIAGEPFTLEDRVFGLSVSTKSWDYSIRQLYFHALADITENSIYLRYLDNQAYWQNPAANPNLFTRVEVRASQATISAMDKNGNQFFGTIKPLGIACWNTKYQYTGNLKLVAQNDLTFQFISGLKLVNKYGTQELWAPSCRFQKIIRGTRKLNEINYRVQAIAVSELLNCTRCYVPTFPIY